MTTHERRVAALMRFQGMTKAQAEKRAKELAAKKNPAPKRKTRATTQRAAEAYVRRPSQTTKKAPSTRLKKRRTKNLQSPRGVFPNPVQKPLTSRPRKAKNFGKMFMVEAKHGSVWKVEGMFPDEEAAREYAYALNHKYENRMYIRVTI